MADNIRLIEESHEDYLTTPDPDVPVPLTRKAKILLGAIGALACCALVVGLVLSFPSHPSDGNTPSGSTGNTARPSFDYHPLLASLANSSHSGFQTTFRAAAMSQSTFHLVHDDGNTQTTLSYNITRKGNVVSLDSHAAAMATACEDNMLHIMFNSSTSAQEAMESWGSDFHVTLRHEWGCGEHIRQVTGNVEINGHMLSMQTKNVSLTDIVKHAEIHFTSNYPSTTYTQQVDIEIPSGRRRDASSWFSDIESFISDAGDALEQLGNLATTGSWSVDKDVGSKSFSLGPDPCIPSGTIEDTTSSCGANFDITTNLKISISNYELMNIEFTATGNGQVNAMADFSTSGSWSSSKQKQVLNKKILSTAIVVDGITIPISGFAMLYLGYQANAQASLDITAQAAITGDLHVGIQFQPQIESTPNWIHTWNVNQPTASITGHASESATLELNAQPVLLLRAAYIGGPTVQLSLTATTNVDASQDASINQDGQYKACNQGSAHFSDTAQVGLGAALDITIDGKKVFNKKWDLVPFPAQSYNPQPMCLSGTV